MQDVYFVVEFSDLRKSLVILANYEDAAIDEALKTLRDTGVIPDYPRTATERAELGRISARRLWKYKRSA